MEVVTHILRYICRLIIISYIDVQLGNVLIVYLNITQKSPILHRRTENFRKLRPFMPKFAVFANIGRQNVRKIYGKSAKIRAILHGNRRR